jgi:RNA polymerase sigma factor (sigma-70 family)
MDVNQLYRDVKSGVEEAEGRLFNHLAVSFRSFIRLKDVGEDDAEDIVQAALLRIFERYRRVEIRSSFAGWTHEVFRTTIIDHFRKQKKRRETAARLASDQDMTRVTTPNPRLRAELTQCLRAIHKKNQSYARILNLHYQGYSTDEICCKERITSNHLYVILSRARAALRACLRRKGVLGE